MSTRCLHLLEQGPPIEADLTPGERDALLAADAGLELVPVQGSPDRWRIRATDRVGILRAGNLLVEVQPKVPIDRVLFLLGFAGGMPELRVPIAQAQEVHGLLDAMAWIYAEALQRALARGLPHDYVSTDEDGISLRGRIRFEDQIRSRPGIWLPIAIRFDDFTEDTELNRMLKAALRRLLVLPLRQRGAVLELRRWLRVFGEVSDLPAGCRLPPEPDLTRLQRHLNPALSIAFLILRGGSIEPRVGTTAVPSLMFDLAGLFERFVREALRIELGLDAERFPSAGGGIHLDRARRVPIRPDLLWRENGRPMFVGDVKYKHAEDGRGRRDDLYQLLAYTVRLGLRSGTLIHASIQERRVHQIDIAGIELEIVGLDLSLPPAEILVQIRSIAGDIRRRTEGAPASSQQPALLDRGRANGLLPSYPFDGA